MKTIKSLKDIITLEVGDVVVFGDLKYKVDYEDGYFLSTPDVRNDKIFTNLNISKKDFVNDLGIDTLPISWDFPETKSLVALTAIVSALFIEYEKQNNLPKTWEEFCKRNPLQQTEYFIDVCSGIDVCNSDNERHIFFDRNVCTSKQEVEAFLALMQLRQLRKAYVKDWEPNWENAYKTKYCINLVRNNFKVDKYWEASHVLSFPTYELAEQFFNNFKDLLEIAKPLL